MSHHITSNAKLQENKELLHALHDSCKNDCRRDTSSVQKNQQTTSYKFIPKITDIMNSDVVSFFIDFLAVVGAILTVWEYAETRPYKDPQVLIE